MDLSLGEETITTFPQAVKRTFDLAMARLPKELHGHLERATALCLHRHVWFDEDGKHAQVLSSDGQTWYLVNGACTCMDAPQAPQGYCKHKLATMIYRRASELLAQAPGTPAPPVPAALPEAPASANARVVIGGHEVQVTLRDVDEARLLTRLAALLARYPAAPAPAAAGSPAHAAQPTPEGWCLVHHLQMKLNHGKDGRSWWSHRTADGTWCKGTQGGTGQGR